MLRSRIPEIRREMEPEVVDGLRSGAGRVADLAAILAPRGEGIHHIADDIHVVRDGHLEFLVRAGKEDTFYGHILEHGSVHASPRPFLVPALETMRRQVISDVRSAIKRAAH